jgi:hypothetical protein
LFSHQEEGFMNLLAQGMCHVLVLDYLINSFVPLICGCAIKFHSSTN